MPTYGHPNCTNLLSLPDPNPPLVVKKAETVNCRNWHLANHLGNLPTYVYAKIHGHRSNGSGCRYGLLTNGTVGNIDYYKNLQFQMFNHTFVHIVACQRGGVFSKQVTEHGSKPLTLAHKWASQNINNVWQKRLL